MVLKDPVLRLEESGYHKAPLAKLLDFHLLRLELSVFLSMVAPEMSDISEKVAHFPSKELLFMANFPEAVAVAVEHMLVLSRS